MNYNTPIKVRHNDDPNDDYFGSPQMDIFQLQEIGEGTGGTYALYF